VQPLQERGLVEERLLRGGERQVGQHLRVQLLPVALPVRELVGDDVRLEEDGVPEDRHVAREDVAGSEGEREGEADQGEVAHAGARAHVLAGDARDVARELPVGQHRQLATGEPLGEGTGVEPLGEHPHLGLARLAWHRDQVPEVGAELLAERDAPDAPPGAPVVQRVPRVDAQRRALHQRADRRGTQQHAPQEAGPDHHVERRHRPVGGPIGDVDVGVRLGGGNFGRLGHSCSFPTRSLFRGYLLAAADGRRDGPKCSLRMPEARWHGPCFFSPRRPKRGRARNGRKGAAVNNIFYIIGVVVVVLVILGYFGFR
jgi:hypothetical protein